MSAWRSACVTAPYPPELLPNTPRRPAPPQPKRCSISGNISCSRKSSQAPIEAELTYWLPPSRVKQSGKATTTGAMRCSPISRSSRSGKFSRKPVQFVWDRPLPVKPTRSTSSGNPCPSCPAGTYTSTTRTDGSPSVFLLRASLSTVVRLTEPADPKNLRICPTPGFYRHFINGHSSPAGRRCRMLVGQPVATTEQLLTVGAGGIIAFVGAPLLQDR